MRALQNQYARKQCRGIPSGVSGKPKQNKNETYLSSRTLNVVDGRCIAGVRDSTRAGRGVHDAHHSRAAYCSVLQKLPLTVCNNSTMVDID